MEEACHGLPQPAYRPCNCGVADAVDSRGAGVTSHQGKVDQLDPNACARSDTQTTVGKGGEAETHRQDGKDDLSEKLARSGGVICPPEHVDPEIRQPTPPTGGSMPVIPPPGSPGGDQSVQPK